MQTLPLTHIPRPTFADAFVELFLTAFVDWSIGRGATHLLPETSLIPSFLRALAHESGRDPALYEKNLQSFHYPIDDMLRSMLITSLKKIDWKLRLMEMEWVMKTGTRWKLPIGHEVVIKDPSAGNTHRSAKVTSIDRVTAKAKLTYVYTPKNIVTAHAEAFQNV